MSEESIVDQSPPVYIPPIKTNRKLIKKSPIALKHSVSVQASPTCGTTNVAYHGGKMVNSRINVYAMFFGANSADYFSETVSKTAPPIFSRFVQGLTSSTYANIFSHYNADNQFTYNAPFFGYSTGVVLSDDTVPGYLQYAITQNNWPYDDNAVFLFIFRGDFSYESSIAGTYGKDWCSFYANMTVTDSNNVRHKVSIIPIGDPYFGSATTKAKCNSLYSPLTSSSGFVYTGAGPSDDELLGFQENPTFKSVNGNQYADSMINSLSGSLAGVLTNRNSLGFYRDCDNKDIAAMCTNNFGNIRQDTNALNYNVILANNRKFLLQELWLYGNSSCVLSASVPTNVTLPPQSSFSRMPTARPTLRPSLSPTILVVRQPPTVQTFTVPQLGTLPLNIAVPLGVIIASACFAFVGCYVFSWYFCSKKKKNDPDDEYARDGRSYAPSIAGDRPTGAGRRTNLSAIFQYDDVHARSTDVRDNNPMSPPVNQLVAQYEQYANNPSNHNRPPVPEFFHGR